MKNQIAPAAILLFKPAFHSVQAPGTPTLLYSFVGNNPPPRSPPISSELLSLFLLPNSFCADPAGVSPSSPGASRANRSGREVTSRGADENATRDPSRCRRERVQNSELGYATSRRQELCTACGPQQHFVRILHGVWATATFRISRSGPRGGEIR